MIICSMWIIHCLPLKDEPYSPVRGITRDWPPSLLEYDIRTQTSSRLRQFTFNTYGHAILESTLGRLHLLSNFKHSRKRTDINILFLS